MEFQGNILGSSVGGKSIDYSKGFPPVIGVRVLNDLSDIIRHEIFQHTKEGAFLLLEKTFDTTLPQAQLACGIAPPCDKQGLGGAPVSQTQIYSILELMHHQTLFDELVHGRVLCILFW